MKKYIIFTISVFFITLGSVLFFQYSKIQTKVSNTKQQIEQLEETVIPKPTKILSDGLPDKHLIKTAFVQQAPEHNWDQPWQDACEEAALLTVDFYYKNQAPTVNEQRNTILSMINFETKQNWTHDINLDQMAIVSSQYLNLKPQIIINPTIEIIKKYLVDNVPVIIPANGKTLFKENKNFKSGGPYYHNLIILGYDDNKKQFIVHDVGTRLGAYFRYSYKTLMESIHDFPSSGYKEDINSGAKKILILLK